MHPYQLSTVATPYMPSYQPASTWHGEIRAVADDANDDRGEGHGAKRL